MMELSKMIGLPNTSPRKKILDKYKELLRCYRELLQATDNNWILKANLEETRHRKKHLRLQKIKLDKMYNDYNISEDELF